mmetsp:Transcript_3075/g.6958  ORF Transcript_3075/g.6958 Transcript_3075/m.6958 type:complete len:88 (+) Transcript_3075:167-430(+)
MLTPRECHAEGRCRDAEERAQPYLHARLRAKRALKASAQSNGRGCSRSTKPRLVEGSGFCMQRTLAAAGRTRAAAGLTHAAAGPPGR